MMDSRDNNERDGSRHNACECDLCVLQGNVFEENDNNAKYNTPTQQHHRWCCESAVNTSYSYSTIEISNRSRSVVIMNREYLLTTNHLQHHNLWQQSRINVALRFKPEPKVYVDECCFDCVILVKLILGFFAI